MPNFKIKPSVIAIAGGLFVFASVMFAYAMHKKSNEKMAEDIQPKEEEIKTEAVQEEENVLEDTVEEVADENIEAENVRQYPIHKNITSTIFWVGEKGDDANKDISNKSSAWDDDWVDHFGGKDTSNKRNGFYPAAFIPKENPFYFALPYNDFDKNGNHKSEIFSLIPWAKDNQLSSNQSYCKNRWMKITKNGKSAYAQWEDVGPFKENDSAYVFGTGLPASKTNKHSGLDVSPAVRDYLGLEGIDNVDWQFIEESQVPSGPWKKIITRTQVNWN